MIGGSILKHNILKYIESIGFEIETTDLVKFTITPTESNDVILINSALTNVDLEYGYEDENEYTNIKLTDNESFKITNDAAEDSDFNELVKELYDKDNINDVGHDESENEEDEGDDEEEEDGEEDEDECKEPVIKLEIPKIII